MQSPDRSIDSIREEDEDEGVSFSSASASPSAFRSSSSSSSSAHTRTHSRIHERNLSAFFPRPGQQATGYGNAFGEDPRVAEQSRAGGGAGEVPFAGDRSPVAARGGGEGTSDKSQAGRRGHHHRHSVSHNLFPFLDPAAAGGHPQPPSSSSPVKTLSQPRRSIDVQLPAATASFRQRFGHLSIFLQVLAFASFHVPLATRTLLLLAVGQIALGAVLWVQGQSGESLAVTGLGYLVVFDGMGGLSSLLLELPTGTQSIWDVVGSSKDSSIRQPFGSFRLITLSHFSQAVYLLFSAVYVCKESIEHVLLLHDPQDLEGSHGAGHGGVGHGEGRSVAVDAHDGSVSIPRLVLFLTILAAGVLATAARNHQGLSASLSPVGSVRETTRSRQSQTVKKIFNAFTLTTVLFSTALLTMAFILPSAQLAPVDKVLALLESIAMFYIASPAAAATGQVLLQTSFHPQQPEMRALDAAISEIESLPLVHSVESRHVWQLATPASASAPAAPRQAVVTLTVLVKHDAADNDLLEVTRFAQERAGAGEGGVDVDLTVAVKRV